MHSLPQYQMDRSGQLLASATLHLGNSLQPESNSGHQAHI
jgi:hypothetical protein